MTTRQISVCALAPVVVTAASLFAAGLAFGQAPAADAAKPKASAYERLSLNDPEVQSAVKVAVAKQDNTRGGAKLLSVVSAERQPISSQNMRLCLAMDRNGDQEFARVVLSRSPKKQWAVKIWSWGSCSR